VKKLVSNFALFFQIQLVYRYTAGSYMDATGSNSSADAVLCPIGGGLDKSSNPADPQRLKARVVSTP
jgi:hypothetical protein